MDTSHVGSAAHTVLRTVPSYLKGVIVKGPILNERTGGQYAVFQKKGSHYLADKSEVVISTFDSMQIRKNETMIFPCDSEGEVTDWLGVYCDRTDKPLMECIAEFCGIDPK